MLQARSDNNGKESYYRTDKSGSESNWLASRLANSQENEECDPNNLIYDSLFKR